MELNPEFCLTLTWISLTSYWSKIGKKSNIQMCSYAFVLVWGQGDQIRPIFDNWPNAFCGQHLKAITRVSQFGLLFHRHMCVFTYLTKNVLGYIFGVFSQNLLVAVFEVHNAESELSMENNKWIKRESVNLQKNRSVRPWKTQSQDWTDRSTLPQAKISMLGMYGYYKI
jgi:hypothetical protein